MKKNTVKKNIDGKQSGEDKPTEKEYKNAAYAKAMIAVFNYYEYEDDFETLEKILLLKLDGASVSDSEKKLIEENQDFFDNPDITERFELVAKMLLSLKEMESCEVGRCIRSFKSEKNKARFNEWLEKLKKRGLKNLPEPFKV